MKAIDFEFISNIIEDTLTCEMSDGSVNVILVSKFETWLDEKGYLDSFHVTPDHNGEPLEHSYHFENFEEWSLDKSTNDILAFINDYLHD